MYSINLNKVLYEFWDEGFLFYIPLCFLATSQNQMCKF